MRSAPIARMLAVVCPVDVTMSLAQLPVPGGGGVEPRLLDELELVVTMPHAV
jgi:hypothetical protein